MIESTLKIGNTIHYQAICNNNHPAFASVVQMIKNRADNQLIEYLAANKGKVFSICYSESIAADTYLPDHTEFRVEIELKPIDKVLSVYPKNPDDIHDEPQRILEERW